MIATRNDLKRWTILDLLTGKIKDITDKEFQEGLEIEYIELRGKYITVENNKRIWIDGILKK